jgi:environmental stress-induced protein Ves
MTLVRKYRAYRRMPWKNGRGFTLEIAREPAAGEDFAWRLSLADIDRDGDFSAYPGYRRALVLVAGERLRLTFRGHGRRTLDPARRGARFEGDWETHCAIPRGRCTDLSLIVSKGSGIRLRAPKMLRVGSAKVGPAGSTVLAANLHAALFVIAGSVAVIESTGARPRTLRALDTLLLSPGRRRTLRFRGRERSGAQLVLLSWRPGHPKIGSGR